MSFTDRLREWQNRPGNEAKTSDQLMTEIYNSQESRIKGLRKDLKESQSRERKPISVDINASGELYLQSKSYDKALKAKSVATRVLLKSESLKQLDGILSNLLEMTKSIYAAGGLLNDAVRTEKDSQGNYTKTPLKSPDGEDLYQVNPLTRLKMVCWILDNNDQAKEALKVISDVLSKYDRDTLKDMAVVKSDINSTKPVKPSALESLMSQLAAERMVASQNDSRSSSGKKGSDSPAGD